MDCLKYICEFRHIDTTDKPRKTIISDLSKNVSSQGLYILLKIVKMTQLKALAKHCDWAKKMPSSKATLAKKLYDTMEEETPKSFLAECDSGLLKEILEGLEVDPKNYARKEYASAIITTAETYGLENCFSSFPVTKLKEFVRACQLMVDSDSMDVLLQALMEQVSIIAPYELEGETPSKEKPKLDKNIRIVDLWHFYYREELAFFLEDRNLLSHGNKKELIERVHRALNDKLYEKGDRKQDKRKKIQIHRERSYYNNYFWRRFIKE
jgi:hypothetical protein